jgi:hypothetical protein
MIDFIEADALTNTPDAPPETPHEHHAVFSFTATPRTDTGLLQKMLSWWKSELTPGLHVVGKANGLRHMFIITSNSYEDRENETITSQALKAYEDSCYPGDGLFHCDNPLLWWHDDDIVMGEIVAVNYSEPFLIEVARELPTPVSKVLWDYAEQNGDKAGASHRFGYYEGDKQADGSYTRIFKQETTYLPERALAANIGTYAGVMNMASPQSDARINQIFSEATGGLIPNAAEMLHAKSGELAKKLADLGVQHKSLTEEKAKPPVPPLEADAVEGAAEVVEDVVEAKAELPIPAYATAVNQILALVMELVDAQAAGVDREMAMAKSLTDLQTVIDERQTAEKAHTQTLEAQIKALSQRVDIHDARAKLQPRSVTQEKGETAPEAIKAAVEAAEDAKKNELVDTPFGKMKPLAD